MRIGELAKAVDCHIETVRYYEKIGLLSAPIRKANGYRDYSEIHLQHLRLIRRARSLGFSQKEVRNIIDLTDSKESSCNQVHELALNQLDAINLKMKEMRQMKKALTSLSDACVAGSHQSCPILEELIK